jgi:hypothetical protein
MQHFHRITTILIFAIHAMLGCGAHHTCAHAQATAVGRADRHADHGCPAGHHHDSAPDEDNDREPASPCQHVACSFVKVDPLPVDQGQGDVAWVSAWMLADGANSAQPIPAAFDLPCKANQPSVQIYVWHCALLI